MQFLRRAAVLKTFAVPALLLLVLAGARAQAPPDGTEFLHLAKILADSGRLDDTGYVAQILHSSFASHLRPQSPVFCNKGPPFPNGRSAADFVTLYEPSKDFWFKPSPGGRRLSVFDHGAPSVSDPGNPLVTMENPSFEYSLNKIAACGADGVLHHRTEAKLDFRRIPGFSCVTEMQVRSVFSGLAEVKTTNDGDKRLHYEGKSSAVDFAWMKVTKAPGQRDCETELRIDGVYSGR